MSEPIRVLHFADTHVGMENYGRISPDSGLSTRVEDFLRRMDEMVQEIGTDIDLAYVANEDPRVNDGLMAQLPDGSVVINATGMGKDTPGSPISDEGLFPRKGIAWEFNYRGELDFLHQALRQEAARELTVEDGWVYFVHGWSQVIGQVLDVEITEELFDRLERAAAGVKG